MLLDSVRALGARRIAPRAAGYDRASGDFPWDNVGAINALGLNAMFVPEAYGGAGLSYAAYLACVREIEQGLRLDRHHLGDQFPRDEAADRFRRRGAETTAAAARRRGRARAHWRSPSPTPARTRPA